jgi:DNA repair protein RadC
MLTKIDPAAEPHVSYDAPIRNWHVSERPREKLRRHGVSHLSDPELIALIFGSGTRTRSGTVSAVELGRSLLTTYGSLRSISRRELPEITRILGIGPAKAVQLLAAFEIGRRIESEREETRVQISGPEDIAASTARRCVISSERSSRWSC